MTSKIACIVEGHGEVEALPVLLRRFFVELNSPIWPEILPPIRVSASKLLKTGELEKAVEFAARKAGEQGAVFILLDCDDGCPATEGPQLLARALAQRSDVPLGLVLAKCEYEAWFLASAESLRGHRKLPDNLEPPHDPEGIRGAKYWLSVRMPPNNPYSETVDQAALTSLFDLQLARTRSNSFDKCYREISRILDQMALNAH